MSSQANISKSVARTFRVLELFRELRRPLTAAQIQHALKLPQPSTRVLLHELVGIGYLAYTMPARTCAPHRCRAHATDRARRSRAGPRAIMLQTNAGTDFPEQRRR